MVSIEYIRAEIKEYGYRSIPKLLMEWIYKKVEREETVIWEHDWDLLIVLDACRLDWIEYVSSHYDFINELGSIWSVGSHSREWIRNTFTEEYKDELGETIYITGNPFVDQAPQAPKFVENVRRYTRYPTPPAHITTDRAVSLTRDLEWSRCIVHYMQPHKPFYQSAGDSREEVELIDYGADTEVAAYEPYFQGEISFEELRDLFIENLHYVLSEVEILLQNVDAERVAITADHGQALGERFLWDHRAGVQHPVLRQVPWIETTAKDTGKLPPSDYEMVDQSDEEIRAQLEALGYR